MGTGFDVIIAGLGAMGSAAAYHLASEGKRILGLDRFRPPHELGSSHGRTRIIREAYFEHPLYVPLVRRAYDLWADLERKSGQRLLLPTGGLDDRAGGWDPVSAARKSAEDYSLSHEVLSAVELRARFPVFNPTQELVAVAEPRAGILYPELAIRTHLELAAKAGATLRFDEPILNWSADGDGVRITTGKASHRAGRLLLSAGAWTSSLTATSISRSRSSDKSSAGLKLWPHPSALGRRGARFSSGSTLWGVTSMASRTWAMASRQLFTTKAKRLNRTSCAGMYWPRTFRRCGPCSPASCRGQQGSRGQRPVCMYTNTPDGHFILGRHPAWPQVVIASPCSGHGFKFAPVIGEMAAMLLDDRRPPFDLSLFKPERFAAGLYAA